MIDRLWVFSLKLLIGVRVPIIIDKPILLVMFGELENDNKRRNV